MKVCLFALALLIAGCTSSRGATPSFAEVDQAEHLLARDACVGSLSDWERVYTYRWARWGPFGWVDRSAIRFEFARVDGERFLNRRDVYPADGGLSTAPDGADCLAVGNVLLKNEAVQFEWFGSGRGQGSEQCPGRFEPRCALPSSPPGVE
jgi:hypothetical protein